MTLVDSIVFYIFCIALRFAVYSWSFPSNFLVLIAFCLRVFKVDIFEADFQSAFRPYYILLSNSCCLCCLTAVIVAV